MKINNIRYFDLDTQWNLEKVEFNNLTLLVGASGVGKTQILQSILMLKAIVKGKSFGGINWEINFTTLDGSDYNWIGEFESIGRSFFKKRKTEEEENKPKIIYEELSLNGEKIIDRNAERILFKGSKTVRLAQDKSILNLLKEEDLIAPAYKGFHRIIFSDQVGSRDRPQEFNPDFLTKDSILGKYKTIESIRESDEKIITKLYLAYNNAPKIMNTIAERYMDIFPFVEEVKIAPLEFDDGDDTPSILKEIPFVQLKEKNVPDWVIQPQISSGMFRTLIHLSELYLCPEGTVILTDEFENSLGINCIDELTIDLQSSSQRKLQFIITSHHPYIINHVHFKNWKLVTREGSHVVTRNAKDLIDFNKSKQEAFIQLTQLDEFTMGISE